VIAKIYLDVDNEIKIEIKIKYNGIKIGMAKM